MHETKKGFILTMIIPAVIAIIAAVLATVSIAGGESSTKTKDIIISLVIAILLYLVSVQVIWCEGPIFDIFTFFMVKPFSRLGLIFELSLDGILWFIVVKIGLALLGAIISILVALLGIAICMVVSPFSFPFALKSAIWGIRT